MSQDVIPIIIEHINKIPKSNNGIDILILSTGGDPNSIMENNFFA